MAEYLRHSYLIKPARWGSDLDVQKAVRDYYENRLGVAAPFLFSPYWEKSGGIARNVMTFGTGSEGVLPSAARWVNEGVYFPSALALINYGNMTVFNGLPTLTIFLYVLLESVGNGRAFVYRYADSNDLWSIESGGSGYFGESNDLGFLVRTVTSSTQAGYTTSDVLTVGKKMSFAGCFDGSQASNETKQRVYKNGQPVSLTYISALPTVLFSGSAPVYSGGFQGIYYCLKIFPYSFSANQVAIEHENPYAAIQPKSFPHYFFVGESAPASFKPYWIPKRQRSIGTGVGI